MQVKPVSRDHPVSSGQSKKPTGKKILDPLITVNPSSILKWSPLF